MIKVLKPLLAAVAVAMLVAYFFRVPLRDFADDKLTKSMFVSADTDSFSPGPVTGSLFPGLRASHNGQNITMLQSVAGSEGTAFIASRSYDWCPYCIRQIIQLQAHRGEFRDAGIGLVVMSYDPPELLRIFKAKYGITIPLLSDVDALSFKTLGILDQTYKPGEERYGIAYPGVIIVDRDGRVAGTLFLEDPTTRVSAQYVLSFAKQVLNLD
ncbi:MAG: peroxiredoxin family protein [Halioglobus sp.]|nr:peroxiredoxin family protein [Halioglobus sp.]